MDLVLLFDHRFYRDSDGIVFSAQNYNYELFEKRYLKVFNNVHIVARVSDSPPRMRKEGEQLYGKGVEFISLGDWNGPLQFAPKYRDVEKKLYTLWKKDIALIMVAPGIIGSIASSLYSKWQRPYGVEVVGDPYDAFAPNAVKHPMRPLFRWWFAKQLRRQCVHAAATTYVTTHALQERYPPADKAFTIACSDVNLPEDAFISAPRNYSKARDESTLITVGTMSQLYKAQDILIDAVAMCIAQGMRLKLILVGDGKYRNEIQTRATSLGIKEFVIFRGQLPAGEGVRAELDKADLFILPSRQEGLPRALIEAMARGLPCIGTTVGGIPELLPADDLVAPDDVLSLAQKIQDIVTNPARMNQMSARNLEIARLYKAETLQERRLTMYRYLRDVTMQWINGVRR